MIYTEPFDETSNIIINHLTSALSSLVSRSICSQLLVVSDTHSTQRSHLVVAFFDYVTRFLKLFGPEGKVLIGSLGSSLFRLRFRFLDSQPHFCQFANCQVKLVYYLSGHHDNDGDRAKLQQKYYSCLKGGNDLS